MEFIRVPYRSLLNTTAETRPHTWRRGLGMARRGVEGAGEAVQHPGRLASLGTDGLELAQSAMRQVLVTDHARSPLWTQRSLRRHVEVLQVPFDEAKAATKALGGSLNDLFVTAAAGGAGAVHRAAGLPVDELRSDERRVGKEGGSPW